MFTLWAPLGEDEEWTNKHQGGQWCFAEPQSMLELSHTCPQVAEGENWNLCVLLHSFVQDVVDSLPPCVFVSGSSLCPSWETSSLCQYVCWLVRLSVRLQLLPEFNLTALWQIQIYDLRKRQDRGRAWPALPPLPSNIHAGPSFSVHSAPGALALIAIPSLRSLLVNGSSHSGYHNRRKASLEVFIVVNVVKVLMGGIKSGAQTKYLLRISWKAFLKLLRDDMVVLEMSLSLLAQSKCGFIDKTNQEMCLSTWEWHTLNLRLNSIKRHERHSFLTYMMLSLKPKECV